MKIVIVENPRPLTVEHYNDVANAPLSASLNSGYALAVARLAGWESTYLDFTASLQSSIDIAALILAEEADVVLFHWVYSWGYEETVCSVLELLHRNSAASLGAFGLFPTLSCSRLLQFAPQLDFILNGEFEATLAELLPLFKVQRPLPLIPGVATRDREFVPRPLMTDLSRLPPPDDVGANCNYSSLNIAASRGCYGECSFCFIRCNYGSRRRRMRDCISLEQELDIRLSRRAVKSLYFVDPTFIGQGTGERGRVIAISKIAQRRGLSFGFETRADSFDAELMTTLVANGATSVFLGIESGCDSVLQRIGKRITTEQIRRAVEIARGSGIVLNLGFIMFEPDSTLPELEENYRFLESLDLLGDHELTANLLYHNQIVLYGSSAWRHYEREGRLLLGEHLPFEARYRFRDERVGLVCAAMGRITSRYFRVLDDIRQQCSGCGTESGTLFFNGGDINALLKNTFCSLCRAAYSLPSQQIDLIELEFAAQITFCCSTSAACGN